MFVLVVEHYDHIASTAIMIMIMMITCPGWNPHRYHRDGLHVEPPLFLHCPTGCLDPAICTPGKTFMMMLMIVIAMVMTCRQWWGWKCCLRRMSHRRLQVSRMVWMEISGRDYAKRAFGANNCMKEKNLGLIILRLFPERSTSVSVFPRPVLQSVIIMFWLIPHGFLLLVQAAIHSVAISFDFNNDDDDDEVCEEKHISWH